MSVLVETKIGMKIYEFLKFHKSKHPLSISTPKVTLERLLFTAITCFCQVCSLMNAFANTVISATAT